MQLNGKVKEKIMIKAGLSREEFQAEAMEHEKVKALLAGKSVVKIVPVPGKLLNVVIK